MTIAAPGSGSTAKILAAQHLSHGRSFGRRYRGVRAMVDMADGGRQLGGGAIDSSSTGLVQQQRNLTMLSIQ